MEIDVAHNKMRMSKDGFEWLCNHPRVKELLERCEQVKREHQEAINNLKDDLDKIDYCFANLKALANNNAPKRKRNSNYTPSKKKRKKRR